MMDKKLQTIITNNKWGSREILVNLNKYLAQQTPVKIKKLIPSLKSKFTEFYSIKKYLSDLESAIKKNEQSSFFNSQIIIENSVYQKIFKNLPYHIKQAKNILTFSNSKTVFEILKLLGEKNKRLTITIAESRPKLEGKIFAKKIAGHGIKINFITEAQLPQFVKKCAAALIGADTILSNGNVVNKVGSKSLAIICRHYRKPFYVIADKSKISKRKTFKQNAHPNAEIWNTKLPNINIENYYFEEIEAELIAQIITD